MTCCGEHRKAGSAAADSKPRPSDYFIYPAEGCVLCAEKHLSAAFALAGEAGYATPNRQRIIGELTCAALHLFKSNPEMAERLRGVRKLVQGRREAEVEWPAVLAEMDALAAKSLEEIEA